MHFFMKTVFVTTAQLSPRQGRMETTTAQETQLHIELQPRYSTKQSYNVKGLHKPSNNWNTIQRVSTKLPQ